MRFLILFLPFSIVAQFSHSDSLRGNYGYGRDWWNLKHYELSVTFDIPTQTISGSNRIQFEVEKQKDNCLQIDLQEPMILDSVWVFIENQIHKTLDSKKIKKDGNAYFISFSDDFKLNPDVLYSIQVFFHGKPKVAKKAPWDGGLVWAKDSNGKPWITVACQGLGASTWFPCKDSQFDKPDSVLMHYTHDSQLTCVSNGNFVDKKPINLQQTTTTWRVSNPINNYCMIPYLGEYVNLHEHFKGEKGELEVDYWVIRGNEEKAKQQFQDAARTIEAFEYWFGSYPFYEDGYKLVEAPHLGMEHQSAIAYGNGFKNGYLGTDLSGTGQGLKWDFIIVHESGHEWFGNNITAKDIADMWIHESFTNYSETLFMDYWFGTAAGNEYCIGTRKNIKNDKPIIGQYGVNQEGSGDMYYKGGNMLHAIRQIVNNDTIFRAMLRQMNAEFYHKTVTTQEIETFMSHYLKLNLTTIFDAYLRSKNPPVLEYTIKKGKLSYRWAMENNTLIMPVKLVGGQIIHPTSNWQKTSIHIENLDKIVDADYYVLEQKK